MSDKWAVQEKYEKLISVTIFTYFIIGLVLNRLLNNM